MSSPTPIPPTDVATPNSKVSVKSNNDNLEVSSDAIGDALGSDFEEDLGSDFEEDLGSDFEEDLGSDFEEDLGSDFEEDLGSDFEEDLGSDFEEDLGSDFEEDISNPQSSTDATMAPGHHKKDLPVTLIGHFKISSSYNFAHKEPEPNETDWRGLSRLRSELFLELDAKFSSSWKMKISGSSFYDAAYAINGRSDYTDDVLDNYESETEIRKAYIEGNITEKLDLKLGRQIVVWGKSDNIRVTDVLNPLNLREPGMTDLEDLRLPVCMTKLDYYIGAWSISGIAVHEKRFNKMPEYGSDFYPLPYPYKYPPEVVPSNNLSDTEYGLSLNGVFSGWDLSLYYADYYDDIPYLQLSSLIPNQNEMHHARLTMLGADINIALGNWLLKTEAAYFDGIKFSDYPTPTLFFVPLSQNDYSKTSLLAGIEYSGFTDTTLSLEGMNSLVHDIDNAAINGGVKENSFQSAVRITRNFLHERLTMTFLASIYGEKGDDGGIYRLSSEYDFSDNLLITGGIVLYESGDLPVFQNIGDNDRVYLDLEYSF